MARPVSKVMKPVKGRRLRVTRLDGCGRFVYGDASTVVSNGFVSVAYSAITVESDEINQTNAAGERCIYEPAKPSLVGYSAEITFCEVDFELFSLITGSPLIYGPDDEVIGFAIDTSIDMEDTGFGLEVWVGTAGGDACLDPNASGNFGYVLNPFFQGGIVGDYTIENGAVTFTITGANTRDGSPWGVGPYNVILNELGVAGPLLSPVNTTTPMLVMNTNVAPPSAVYGARPLMDPDATELTAITAVATGLSVDITATPADLNTPVYYEFGDGTWDYIAASADGATTHVYASPGTYTIRGTSNGVWVEEEVTVSA